MMTATLTKHHGLGNDFLVVVDSPVPDDELPAFVRRVCDRRRGIGADGLMVVEPPPDVEQVATTYGATMLLFNADGSRAEMSGNGIRCFAQAMSMERGHMTGPVTIHTDAGVRIVDVEATDEPQTIIATVDMGTVDTLPEPDGWARTECHPDRPVAHLSLGNPHSVVGVDDVDVVDLADLGRRVPHVNLEIVAPMAATNAIRMRVHERGVGVTEACGTGAVASAVAAADWGLVTPREGRIEVIMDGGAATVALETPEPGRVSLRGPATFVGTVEVSV